MASCPKGYTSNLNEAGPSSSAEAREIVDQVNRYAEGELQEYALIFWVHTLDGLT